jgi:spectrin beta
LKAKLDQLQDDLQGYADILDRERAAGDMASTKWTATLAQCNDMRAQIDERKAQLSMQLSWLEFDRDSAELLRWLAERRAVAAADDYGHDLEHLILIREKFAKLRDECTLTCDTRLGRLRQLGTQLLAAKHPEAKSTRKRLDDLRATREHLDNELRRRDSVLSAAAELHTFNRDVQDLLRRIGDKELVLFDEERAVTSESAAARDSRTCQTLHRAHLIIVDELNTVRVQLYELNQTSERLRAEHPGDTAESVAGEMVELIERFGRVWRAAEARTVSLDQAQALHRFMAIVRDANAWIEDTRRSITGTEFSLNIFSNLVRVTEPGTNL